MNEEIKLQLKRATDEVQSITHTATSHAQDEQTRHLASAVGVLAKVVEEILKELPVESTESGL